ncbi:hypothetical protein BJ986_002823 [Phycicoccus badiiscoriae]|uniref:Lipoprotein n=1 Tax=Pedococcus badiiscoriae TaxID=642776 RepID=A0A852WSS8_9MICO|nr:hypothetical protein [Pedococcus badiiscoriae]NYG08336.1 hypothetical protein [Pedococcus badiiscoriae]
MPRLLTAVTAAVLLTAAGTGCSADSPAPGATPASQVATYRAPSAYRVGESRLRLLVNELDPGSPQRQILADGHVSRSELDQAWRAYAGCVSDVGFEVSDPVWDPVSNVELLYTYRRVGAALPSSAGDQQPTEPTDEASRIDDCEASYWFPVWAIYAADTPTHMTPLLAGAVVACMSRRGYDVRGSTGFGQVVGARNGYAEGARVEAGRSCVSEAMAAHYPDLPYRPIR